MSADYVCKAIDPANPEGPKIDVVFPAGYTLRLFKYWRVDYENLRAAKHVLEHTARIFFGVREFNDGGWCYTGRPATWLIKERIEVPFPNDKVFAVYVNPNMQVCCARLQMSVRSSAFRRSWAAKPPKGGTTNMRQFLPRAVYMNAARSSLPMTIPSLRQTGKPDIEG